MVSILFSVHAHALAPKTLSELYQKYNMIIQGQVISVSANPEKNLTSYNVKVNEYLKNPQDAQIITAIYAYTNSSDYPNPTFNVGDNVQLYLSNGIMGNVLDPYSFMMDKKCGGLGPNTFSMLPGVSAPAVNNHFLDSKGDAIVPSINKEFFIKPDFVNDTPFYKLDVEISIKLDGNSTVFYDKRQIDAQPCSGVDYTWKFTPKLEGDYAVELTRHGGLYDNKIIFDNYSSTTTFTIAKESRGIDKFLSPLKQFKSGIAANDIRCRSDFQLVIKSDDGSPACVKPQTAQKLVERGWAKQIF